MKRIGLLMSASLVTVLMTISACAQESMTPTHTAKIQLEPIRYSDLLKELDVLMATRGLSRFGAEPGLSETYGRSVLYFEYRLSASEKWAFLTANDLSKVGIVDIRVYANILKVEQVRVETMSQLDIILSKYGARLQTR